MNSALGRGALFALAAAAAFAGMSALIRIAGEELPNTMVVFFRNLFALVLLLAWTGRAAGPRSGFATLATRRLPMHLLRGATGLAAMYCFFYALSEIPLASAVLLNYSQPLFIPFIAWAWIGERPPARVYPAIVIGFFGVALILKPGLDWVGAAGAAGLASGIFAALSMTAIRRMSDTEPALRIVFYFSLIGTLVSALPAALQWQTPSSDAWAALLGAAGIATVGQLSLTRAYALAPAAQIGTLIYMVVIFAALIGWLVWGETPDAYSAIGAAAVILAALIVVLHRSRPEPTAYRP